ncbi:aminoglycoside phosphotransferase family protein [Streptomyces sp. YU58]|uniref:aminoglycoside phosphotransferase family protein n=1 Tax=Streptomyces sp. SX92 TaxID=3158972 RepID=UPI0027BA186F|nr:aminoglycoside phosphotransferase family protein [Streptomyces coralus]WLW53996.1 aminoglycoside phosphotransferase family protein [Streptomyces coralus]
MIAVPESFVTTTVEREATEATDKAADWLRELPSLVEELLTRWDCVPDGEVMHGGVGLIVPVRRGGSVRRAGGAEDAVLKVSFPHPGNVHEPDAFTVWGGRGAVLLYERDDERFAMLLERAGTRTLAELGAGDEDGIVTVAGRLNRRLAVPAPPGLPRLSARAGEWERELLADAEELPHSLSRRALDAALATVRDLGSVQPDTVLHGDLHARNILRADREPWLAVDPKGYAGDPAYDGGTLLKSRGLSLIEADDLPKAVHRILDVFAEAAEVDRERVRRWSQFHAVQAAFHGRRHGFRVARVARVARDGRLLDGIVRFAEELAELLTE